MDTCHPPVVYLTPIKRVFSRLEPFRRTRQRFRDHRTTSSAGSDIYLPCSHFLTKGKLSNYCIFPSYKTGFQAAELFSKPQQSEDITIVRLLEPDDCHCCHRTPLLVHACDPRPSFGTNQHGLNQTLHVSQRPPFFANTNPPAADLFGCYPCSIAWVFLSHDY